MPTACASTKAGRGRRGSTPVATWQRTRLPIGHRTPVRAGELRDQDQCHPPSGGWHWPEWIAEAVGTATLFGIGFSVVAVLLSQRSPIADAVHGIRFLLVGVNFGVLSAAIAVSPLGRRSGAHLNPAVTLGFWLRGSVHPTTWPATLRHSSAARSPERGRPVSSSEGGPRASTAAAPHPIPSGRSPESRSRRD